MYPLRFSEGETPFSGWVVVDFCRSEWEESDCLQNTFFLSVRGISIVVLQQFYTLYLLLSFFRLCLSRRCPPALPFNYILKLIYKRLTVSYIYHHKSHIINCPKWSVMYIRVHFWSFFGEITRKRVCLWCYFGRFIWYLIFLIMLSKLNDIFTIYIYYWWLMIWSLI